MAPAFEDLDLVVRGGVIVTAGSCAAANVGVRGERIVAIGEGLPPAKREIDASGKLVIPGGVDVHTHLDASSGDVRSRDDFYSGTVAAACGGTTTIVDFCQQARGQSLAEALATWHAKAGGKAVIDYGFHIIVVDMNERTHAELAGLPAQGVSSFKLFMAYKSAQMVDDRTLLRALDQAAKAGALVMVHAENGDAVDFLVEKFLGEGKTEPKYHALSRPPRVESEATARAIAMAELVGAPIYVVHVTCADALDEVVRGRRRGVDVIGETCTHYLYSTAEDLARDNFEGAKWVFTPPPRTSDDQKALWRALSLGELAAVSSDHGSWGFSDHRQRGRNDFSQIPNGAVGIEERMTMVYQGVVRNLFSVNRFVEIVSTGPARLFGLFPRKGAIAVGSDADLVVWDPDATAKIAQRDLHHGGDYSLYEGIETRGRPSIVIRRGEVIVQDRAFVGRRGSGRFVARTPFRRANV